MHVYCCILPLYFILYIYLKGACIGPTVTHPRIQPCSNFTLTNSAPWIIGYRIRSMVVFGLHIANWVIICYLPTKKGNQETPLIRCRKKHTQILFGTQEWIQWTEWPQVPNWWKTSTGTRGGMEDCIFVSKVVVLKFGGFYMKSSIPKGCLTSCGREWSWVSVNIPMSFKDFFSHLGFHQLFDGPCHWMSYHLWRFEWCQDLKLHTRNGCVFAKRTFVSSLQFLVAVSIGTCATAKDQFLQSRNTFFHRKSRTSCGDGNERTFWRHNANSPAEIRTRFGSGSVHVMETLLALAVLDETYLKYDKVV